ncbi:MAG: DUF1761 domain-containing protein [Bacteroidia bacterium]|nr:DUF1761 domain-containing protein [Bacteroidia bacterium]
MQSPISNPWIFLVTGLIPLVLGFIWYNPKVLGNAWLKASGLDEEKLKGANMALIFGLSYVFSVFLAVAMYPITIHQGGFMSMLMNDPEFGKEGSEITNFFNETMLKYGRDFRTFKHGVLHGILTAITIGLPILGTNALFERKGFKYIAINMGYWIICLALMGGVVCQWL